MCTDMFLFFSRSAWPLRDGCYYVVNNNAITSLVRGPRGVIVVRNEKKTWQTAARHGHAALDNKGNRFYFSSPF